MFVGCLEAYWLFETQHKIFIKAKAKNDNEIWTCIRSYNHKKPSWPER